MFKKTIKALLFFVSPVLMNLLQDYEDPNQFTLKFYSLFRILDFRFNTITNGFLLFKIFVIISCVKFSTETLILFVGSISY